MKKIELRKLHAGAYFHLTDDYNSSLWVRDTYERFAKKYYVYKSGNVCSCSLLKGTLLVYVED